MSPLAWAVVGFLIGTVVGACVGFVGLALCVAARNGDAHLETSAFGVGEQEEKP